MLISDEFTNPHKRRKMVEKRARKFKHVAKRHCAASVGRPGRCRGHAGRVGLYLRGDQRGTSNSCSSEGVTANHLPIKWIVPFHAEAVTEILTRAKRTIIVENNYSGQFFRYLRSETGLAVDGHIRKYDGEPFMPHHIVDGVLEQLAGQDGPLRPLSRIHRLKR